jgi:hypothetical protein
MAQNHQTPTLITGKPVLYIHVYLLYNSKTNKEYGCKLTYIIKSRWSFFVKRLSSIGSCMKFFPFSVVEFYIYNANSPIV